jgi:hypothetical protein
MSQEQEIRNDALEEVAQAMAAKPDGVWANTCGGAIRAMMRNPALAPSAPAVPQIPDVLFDGHAVYHEVMANDPHTPRVNADQIADVLDAVVSLMRKAAPALQVIDAPRVEDELRAALRKAYNFGQTYWQQADSDYSSQHKKSEETARKFAEFVEQTCAWLPPIARQAQPTDRDAWISVDERLPEKYCLAVYKTSRGQQRIIRAMYVKQYEIEATGDECDSETNDADDMEYIKAGWYECIDNWGDYSSVAVCEGVVTHWKPLPALPALKSGGSNTEGAAS